MAPGHDVVLIDMPGIDGAMAQSDTNWMRKELLHQLPNDSHCYLYVHSSISALTSDMAKNLKDWLGEYGRGKSLYLAFNKFDAKPWIKQSIHDEEINKAAREVEGKLKNNFPGVGITRVCLNAAKAWDGCSGNTAIDGTAIENGRDKDTIYKESNIAELYKELSKKLTNEKDKTIYKPIIAKVKQKTNHILELCDGCWAEEIKNQTDKVTEKINKLNNEEEEIKKRINKIIVNSTSALECGLNDKYDSVAGITTKKEHKADTIYAKGRKEIDESWNGYKMNFRDVDSVSDIRRDVDYFLKDIKHAFSSVWTDENKKLIQDTIKDFLKESLQKETNTQATDYVDNTALVSDIIKINVTEERLKNYSPDFSVDDLLSLVNNEKYAVEKLPGNGITWWPRKKRTQDEMESHCEKLKNKLLEYFHDKLDIEPKIKEIFYKPKGETLWVSLLNAYKEKEITRIQKEKNKNGARTTLIRNSNGKASEVKDGANKLLTEMRDAE